MRQKTINQSNNQHFQISETLRFPQFPRSILSACSPHCGGPTPRPSADEGQTLVGPGCRAQQERSVCDHLLRLEQPLNGAYWHLETALLSPLSQLSACLHNSSDGYISTLLSFQIISSSFFSSFYFCIFFCFSTRHSMENGLKAEIQRFFFLLHFIKRKNFAH